MDQFLHKCSIFVVLIGCICPLYNRGIAVFSHVGPYNIPYFQEGHIPLAFHLKYFLCFFVNIAGSCVSQMILSAVCICNLFQAIFHHMVRVLFTAFGICLSYSTGLPVVSIFLAFEVPQGHWNVLLDSLKAIVEILLRNWWSCFTKYQQPLGSRGVHYKKELHWRFFLLLPHPPLLATGPFVAALDGKRIWYLPPARTQERWTHMLS